MRAAISLTFSVIFTLAVVLGASAQEAAPTGPYPEEVRAAFMDGCTKEATEVHCACVLSKLEASVPAANVVSGQIDDGKIDELVGACLSEVKIEGAWPAEIRKAFLEGCTKEAGEKQCACVMAKLEAEVAFGDVVNGNIAEDKLNAYIAECR